MARKLFSATAVVFVLAYQFASPTRTFSASDFLGDPGTNIERARANIRERKAQRLSWELATTVEAYERIGNKDGRWDTAAKDALTQVAGQLACTCDGEDCESAIKAALERAISAGCTDPLVSYFGLRYKCYPINTSAVELARMYAKVAQQLQTSEYPAIRKCFVSVRAADAALEATRTSSNASLSELRDSVPVLLARAEKQFENLLRDQLANRDSVYDLTENAFLDLARDVPFGRALVFEALAKFFETNKSKTAGDEAGAGLIEGTFWSQYAWDARGSGWSSEITENGWKLFAERLEKAQTLLERAWVVDPGDPHIAIAMMTVELGQGLGRERLELWFRRAMNSDPDSCEAAHKKMLYLEPKWYGSAGELLSFAHQCVATANWQSRIPFVLISAYSDLAELSGRANEYWRQADVWDDVEKFYRACLAANPRSVRDRSYFALLAYRAEKWNLANELFNALGNKPDLKALKCSMPQYDQMRLIAAAKAKGE